MKKILLFFIASLAFLTINAQESGTYYLYAWDKVASDNIYIPLSSTDGDMYSATGYTFNGSTDLSGIQVVYGNWDNYYSAATDTWPEVTLGSVIDLVEGGAGSGWIYGWTLSEDNYIFFQLSTLKLALSENDVNPITGTSSVKGLTSETETLPTYYNLQGVQLNNPQKGICIMKQNGKTVKVLNK